MQPTFLPWIGYFALIDRVDEFIFLDNVQFDKRSWQQRNKIKTPNGTIWLSVPVITKGRSDQLIKDVEILYEGDKNPLLKILKSIEQNYAKSPLFEQYFPTLKAIMEKQPQYLADLNIEIIRWICREMGIKPPFVKASEMDVVGTKDELLFDICKKAGASDYLSPPGSKGYLDQSSLFHDGEVALHYHDYEHPEYTQLHGDFEAFTSVIDLMFNHGAGSFHIVGSGL